MQACKSLSLILMSFTLAAAAHGAPAYPEYRVTVVGPANSDAADINNAGVVVGTRFLSPTVSRGFLNRGKGLVDIGPPGGRSSTAVAINDKGQVLGNWATKDGQGRGYIHAYGKARDIGVIPGRGTRFTDINNAGYATAIGFLRDPDSPPDAGFLRSPGDAYTRLGSLPAENPITNPWALNNRNQVTGESGQFILPEIQYRPFLWTRGVMRELGNFGLLPAGGLDVNDRGQVTGYASVTGTLHNQTAFLYSNGRLVDLDTRPASADRFSSGTGINNHGQVVGYSNHLSGFIYRSRRMESLNALIDPKGGWDIWRPEAINDAGQIAATALRKGVRYAVRLDLIRPSALAAPALEPDAEAAAAAALSPAQAAAQAKAEADAQESEVAQPVKQ